jgi:hypothetical protein
MEIQQLQRRRAARSALRQQSKKETRKVIRNTVDLYIYLTNQALQDKDMAKLEKLKTELLKMLYDAVHNGFTEEQQDIDALITSISSIVKRPRASTSWFTGFSIPGLTQKKQQRTAQSSQQQWQELSRQQIQQAATQSPQQRIKRMQMARMATRPKAPRQLISQTQQIRNKRQQAVKRLLSGA